MAKFIAPKGTYTIAEGLAQKLLLRWVPKWYGAFVRGRRDGLFHERLGRGFRPLETGRARLLSQLRQLAIYADAQGRLKSWLFAPQLKTHFDEIVENYSGKQAGTWHYALDDDGRVCDPSHDLYTHAFVIFAFSLYGRVTGDTRASTLAGKTCDAINTFFRQGVDRGFGETYDESGRLGDAPRRHESHMHLLEACLFAHEVWQDKKYLDMADEIVGLFFDYFYDSDKNMLSEYFTIGLSAAEDPRQHAVICEPGHYYEWIWLLKKHAARIGEPEKYDHTCLRMLEWANRHGWDEEYGGIYDELAVDGRVLVATKRLWPFTEALKANALMLDAVSDRDGTKAFMIKMTTLFRERYMQDRGFWTEWLNRDLTPAVDYMPATTPYHVYFGIMETLDILKRRGASKSWRSGLLRYLYTGQRTLSALSRKITGAFKTR